LYVEGGGLPMRAKVLNDGEFQLDPFEAKAGVEYTINIEWDWTNPELPKDFAIVAYSTDNKVELTH
jgi:hypothetical protein